MQKRYQECNLCNRLHRRLKYQPTAFINAASSAIASYLKKRNFSESCLIFKLLYTDWQVKAKWYYTPEEVMNRIKSKYNLNDNET